MEQTHYTFFDENPGDFLRDRRMHYLMVNAVARRVRQLQTGERALAVPGDGNREVVNIAITEFLDDKLEVVPRQVAQPVEESDEMMLEDSGDDFDFDMGGADEDL